MTIIQGVNAPMREGEVVGSTPIRTANIWMDTQVAIRGGFAKPVDRETGA